jgi:hypothetical protein
VLVPGSLDRIGEESDWLRREVAHALAHDRNVVPMIANGFQFGSDLILPTDMARLRTFNAVSITPEYFTSAMVKLRTRFLKAPSKPTVQPTPEARSFAERIRRLLARPDEITTPPAGAATRAPTYRASGTRRRRSTATLPPPHLTGRQKSTFVIELTWSEVPGAKEYVLERDGREVHRGSAQAYDDTPPVGGTTIASWRYRVRAEAIGHAGTWSEPVERVTGF